MLETGATTAVAAISDTAYAGVAGWYVSFPPAVRLMNRTVVASWHIDRPRRAMGRGSTGANGAKSKRQGLFCTIRVYKGRPKCGPAQSDRLPVCPESYDRNDSRNPSPRVSTHGQTLNAQLEPAVPAPTNASYNAS